MKSSPLLLLLACSPSPPEADTGGQPEQASPPEMELHSSPRGLLALDRQGRQALRFLPQGGVRISSQGRSFELRLAAWGREEALRAPQGEGWQETGCAPDPLGCQPGLWREGQGIAEWWSLRPGEPRQGWEIDEAPPGEGPLLLQLELTGALELREVEGGILAVGPGSVLSYDQLRVWDARGEEVEAWMEAEGSRVTIAVEDEGALYPLTVDPVATSSTWMATGAGTNDYYGKVVAPAGDLNGDGYQDWAVSEAETSAYKVYIYYGSASLSSTTATTTFSGGTTGQYLGWALDAGGDVNNDGYDDLLVSKHYNSSIPTQGTVYYGSASGVSTSSSTGLLCSALYSAARLKGIGDVNNDGYDDVGLAIYSASSASSLPWCVWKGQSGTLSSTYNQRLTSTVTGACGSQFGDAGDVNNDGYADVYYGCSSSSSFGRVLMYHGSSTGTFSTSPSSTIQLGTTYTWSTVGFAVAALGDVNADNYDDLAVGVYGYSSSAGGVMVVQGSSTGITSTPTSTIAGPTGTTGYLGYSVRAADTDGDGEIEVVTNNPSSDDQLLWFEAASGSFDSVAEYSLSGSTTAWGETYEFADFNNDGYDDLIAGQNDYSSNRGRAYIFLGGVDEDGDGYFVAGGSGTVDCDDSDADVNPGETEVTGDGVDSDCSGTETCYTDADGDGYAIATTFSSTDADCADAGEATATEYALGLDCNDTRSSVNPGATEVCDSANTNEDCDSGADDLDPDLDSSSGATLRYSDVDRDGFGGSAVYRCDSFSGTTLTTGDCDDTAAAIRPSASEITGDSVDQNCDGLETCYVDADEDSYTLSTTVASTDTDCADAGEGTSTEYAAGRDCNDGNADINPGEQEVCDSANTDEDCDSRADDADTSVDSSTRSTFYRDADSDTYGDAATSQTVCDASTGYVSDDQDCDDTNSAIHPAATERTGDEVDQNCDDAETCYADADNDGVGTSSATTASTDADCDDIGEATSAEVSASEDCDDADATSYPSATEVCDAANADNDCDGLADDDDTSVSRATMSTWYRDADADGYGEAATTTSACDSPTGYVSNSRDCDDTLDQANPDGVEVCDEDDVDEDCDGLVDDDDTSLSASSRLTWYYDADSDGYGDASETISRCAPPPGYVSTGDDCDDSDEAFHPGALETDCDDPQDYNCDGSVSTDDADGDGAMACEDCNDADGGIGPHAEEICDGIDNDCSGVVDGRDATDAQTWYTDGDGDGYGDNASAVVDCEQPEGTISVGGDCDDTSTGYNPGAVESDCSDPNDYNCDGFSGSDDNDMDGYAACEECDDGDPSIQPGADEDCDGVDQDCDGVIDNGYEDVDGDGLADCAGLPEEEEEEEDDNNDINFNTKQPSVGCLGCDAAGAPPLAGLALLALGMVRRRRR